MAAITQKPSQASNGLRPLSFMERLLRILFGSQEAILFLSLIGLCAYVYSENERFLGTRNVVQILNSNAYVAVAAIGMSLIIIAGHIDISVGSLVAVLAILSGRILGVEWLPDGSETYISWIVPLFVGMGVGAVIGAIVTYLKIPAIIVTLGFFSILKGGLLIFTEGSRVENLPDNYDLARIRPFEDTNLPIAPAFFQEVTMPVVFMVVLTLLMALWLRYSATGRALYAVGGNKEAARLSGISENRMVMTAFILNGLFAGIASILYATQLSVIQATPIPNLELNIITFAVVGGVSILGGTGTVIGTMLAALFISTISKALVFLDISPFWTRAIQGVLILITVLLDLLRRRRQAL
jgi:ribose/xylose/arabinose/galactoside ABC-type transport system permease subunit